MTNKERGRQTDKQTEISQILNQNLYQNSEKQINMTISYLKIVEVKDEEKIRTYFRYFKNISLQNCLV